MLPTNPVNALNKKNILFDNDTLNEKIRTKQFKKACLAWGNKMKEIPTTENNTRT